MFTIWFTFLNMLCVCFSQNAKVTKMCHETRLVCYDRQSTRTTAKCASRVVK